MSVYVLVVSMV